jgi:hypothetical protein
MLCSQDSSRNIVSAVSLDIDIFLSTFGIASEDGGSLGG